MHDSRMFDILDEALVEPVRLLAGRNTDPTAAIILSGQCFAMPCRTVDSETVKSTESGGRRGYNPGN